MIKLCAARLKPGGVLIIETPNPECLAIFATHFYIDPTHTRPVPPALLAFYFEEFGLRTDRGASPISCSRVDARSGEPAGGCTIQVLRQLRLRDYRPQALGGVSACAVARARGVVSGWTVTYKTLDTEIRLAS